MDLIERMLSHPIACWFYGHVPCVDRAHNRCECLRCHRTIALFGFVNGD